MTLVERLREYDLDSDSWEAADMIEQLSKALAFAAPAYFGLVLQNIDEDDPMFEPLHKAGLEMAESIPDEPLTLYETLMLVKSALDASRSKS